MRVLDGKCMACKVCLETCPVGAISIRDKKAHIDTTRCITCRLCMIACCKAAIQM